MEKPDIIGILEKEGVQLKQRGKHFWCLCPFHSEKTASFAVNPEKQSFKCYGCHASGDAIDFVMKYKNIPFQDAVKYLDISSDRQVKTNPQETKRRELIQKFKAWCGNYTKYLCERMRLCNQVDSLVRTPEQLESEGLAEMYLMKDIYQWHLCILSGNDNKSKFQLYEEFYESN